MQAVQKSDMDDPKIRAACKELAEQFIPSWVTYRDDAGKGETINRHWMTWRRNLKRKPLIIQLLEDRETGASRCNYGLNGKRRHESVMSEDRSSAHKREKNMSPAYKRRQEEY